MMNFSGSLWCRADAELLLRSVSLNTSCGSSIATRYRFPLGEPNAMGTLKVTVLEAPGTKLMGVVRVATWKGCSIGRRRQLEQDGKRARCDSHAVVL